MERKTMQTIMSFTCLLVILPILLNVEGKEFKCDDFDICDTDNFQYCDWEEKRCGYCDCDGQSVIPQCYEVCAEKNVCNSNPCENSGICTVNNQDTTGYTCTCSAGFTGPTCNAPINDACTDNPCLNNGVCQVSGTSFECSCVAGYSGTTCQIWSGHENNYIAVIVTVILVLAVITIGIVVLYLHHEKKLCFSQSQSTPDSSAASSSNSLLHKSGVIGQDISLIVNEKKLPIPEEGEPFIEHHHASPTADINSDQHQKVYNPSGINCEIIDESDIKEQTNIKQV